MRAEPLSYRNALSALQISPKMASSGVRESQSITARCDRWHEVLDPLAAAVKRWEAGELVHVDLARAAGRVRKGVSPIDYVFSQKRAMLVRLIEFDEEWSGPWIAAHPRPETPAMG